MFQQTRNLAAKYGRKAAAAAAPLLTAPAFAGELTEMVTAAKGTVDGTKPDLLVILGAILALVVIMWAGYIVIGMFRGRK